VGCSTGCRRRDLGRLCLRCGCHCGAPPNLPLSRVPHQRQPDNDIDSGQVVSLQLQVGTGPLLGLRGQVTCLAYGDRGTGPSPRPITSPGGVEVHPNGGQALSATGQRDRSSVWMKGYSTGCRRRNLGRLCLRCGCHCGAPPNLPLSRIPHQRQPDKDIDSGKVVSLQLQMGTGPLFGLRR